MGLADSLFLCVLEALVDLGPVDGVPPGGEIFGAAVLVLEVVGVLPDVVAEDGVVALGERAVLVGGGGDFSVCHPRGASPSRSRTASRWFR